MGNEMGTMLSKLNKRKISRKVTVKLICETDFHKGDDGSSYFTPKSSSFRSNTEDQDSLVDDDSNHGIAIEFEDVESFDCEICLERTGVYDSFNPKGCTHFYCVECAIRYVASKLDDNLTHITCPMAGCEGLLDPESCRDILPKNVFDRWGIALCESVIDGSKKVYCPYKDCSALLIDDTRESIERLDCPSCKRSFCVKCKVAWHSEFTCAKFQKLKKKGADAMLADLAKRKKWKKCPQCKSYVEKSSGCFYMKCRCGYAFCYNCGASTSSHVCSRCKH